VKRLSNGKIPDLRIRDLQVGRFSPGIGPGEEVKIAHHCGSYKASSRQIGPFAGCSAIRGTGRGPFRGTQAIQP
jgi:hypothetical protein